MYQIKSTYWGDILQEILYVENIKRLICRELLLVKENDLRQKLVYDFLCSDLEKHEILAQAAMMAIEKNEDFFLKRLEDFYQHCEGWDVLYKINTEIMRTQLYINTMEKAMHTPVAISFLERRLIKEIIKYVIAQARYYNKLKSDRRL